MAGHEAQAPPVHIRHHLPEIVRSIEGRIATGIEGVEDLGEINRPVLIGDVVVGLIGTERRRIAWYVTV